MSDMPKRPEEKLHRLTPAEIRTLGLYALGWDVDKIAHRLHLSTGAIKSRMRSVRKKLDIDGAVALALFYVEHVLPRDQLPGYAPGEKLQLWRQRAEQHRARLWEEGVLTPRVIAAAMLLTNPENGDKTDAELAQLLTKSTTDEPLSRSTIRTHLFKIGQALPGRTNKVRIAVIATLAPFDEFGVRQV